MTIRWKPRSEGDGNLVVLTHEPFVLVDGDGSVIQGRSDPRAAATNGYRYAVRYPAPGSAFNGATVRTRGGAFAVPDPRRNWGGGKGPELPPAGSVSSRGSPQPSGNLQQLRQQLATMPYEERRQYLARAIQSDPQLPQKLGYTGSASPQAGPMAGTGLGGLVSTGLSLDVLEGNGLDQTKAILGKGWDAVRGLKIPADGGLRSLGQRFLPNFGSMGTQTVAGTPSVSAALSGAPATPGWAAGINAAAPWAIAGLAGLKLVQGLAAPSAKKRFAGEFKAGMGMDSVPTGFVPSFNQTARRAGSEAAKAGRTTLPSSPANLKGGQMYQSGGKPYVLITKDDPVGRALSSGKISMGGVKLNPAGRVGVNPNQYSNLAASATHSGVRRPVYNGKSTVYGGASVQGGR